MTNVFLVDDHEVVRTGIRSLLEANDDIEVVGEAGSVAETLARFPSAGAEVAVLDVRLPDGNGVELCRELRSAYPALSCLMLTSFADDEALFDAILAGASGYVLKQVRGLDLVEDIRKVASGQSLLDPVLVNKVLTRLRAQPNEDSQLASLTPQERRILDLIAQGYTNRQIGATIFLAEKTVKNYISSMFSKLGMQRRSQAAAYAARLQERQHIHMAGNSGA